MPRRGRCGEKQRKKGTKIIYIVFNAHGGYYGYGYMSPYYSSDGNLCKFDEGTNSFIEIEN